MILQEKSDQCIDFGFRLPGKSWLIQRTLLGLVEHMQRNFCHGPQKTRLDSKPRVMESIPW